MAVELRVRDVSYMFKSKRKTEKKNPLKSLRNFLGTNLTSYSSFLDEFVLYMPYKHFLPCVSNSLIMCFPISIF